MKVHKYIMYNIEVSIKSDESVPQHFFTHSTTQRVIKKLNKAGVSYKPGNMKEEEEENVLIDFLKKDFPYDDVR